MLKILALHIMVLLFLPVLWHLFQKHTEEHGGYAGPQSHIMLPDVTQAYYDRIFSYALENIANGAAYSWQYENSSGSIRVGSNLVSKSKSLCRHFAENYNINGVRGSTQGYGCRRANSACTSNSQCCSRECRSGRCTLLGCA
jgi:hypothetical protein